MTEITIRRRVICHLAPRISVQGQGDCDGVVVVPQAVEDEVFAKAKLKFEKEQRIVEALEQGRSTLEIYGFDKLLSLA